MRKCVESNDQSDSKGPQPVDVSAIQESGRPTGRTVHVIAYSKSGLGEVLFRETRGLWMLSLLLMKTCSGRPAICNSFERERTLKLRS